MAGTKQLIFDPANLYALLVHYTSGECPLNGQVTEVLIHPQLSRYLALQVESQEWTTSEPLHLRYDGQRVMSWTKGQESGQPWIQKNETPKRQ